MCSLYLPPPNSYKLGRTVILGFPDSESAQSSSSRDQPERELSKWAMLCGIRGVYVGAPLDPSKRAGDVAWRTRTTYNNDKDRGYGKTGGDEPERVLRRRFGGQIHLHDPLDAAEKKSDHVDYFSYDTYGDTEVQAGTVVVSDASGSAYVVFTRVGLRATARIEQVRQT